MSTDVKSMMRKLERLNEIGIKLSQQGDLSSILTEILRSAQELTEADGGTFYRVVDTQLTFDVVINKTLDIHLGGDFEQPSTLPAINLLKEDGSENLAAVAAYVGNRNETVNILDVYSDSKFDFSGALAFDKAVNYQTKSMLVIPLVDFDNVVIGVLQLINAKAYDGRIAPFSPESESLARSLASQASVAITNKLLVEQHKTLFDSLSRMIADAIDAKSPSTGKHCERVPVLTILLAEAAIKQKEGVFKDFSMTESEKHELEIAAWLHDCGKLTTPESVMDKSMKLETVVDRVDMIETRLNLQVYQELARKYQIPNADIKRAQSDAMCKMNRIKHMNSGEHFYNAENDTPFIESVASQTITNLKGETQPCMTPDEVLNLQIQRGTLNDVERQKMQDHASMSIKMLEALPFPRDLQRIPEYAGGHHERMDGKGYPNHLTRDELSIPARMMGIADIFEALSAGDRPYKPGKKVSESLRILGFLKKDGHIDSDLFDLFIRDEVYMTYAEEHLKPEQMDEVIKANIPGYEP